MPGLTSSSRFRFEDFLLQTTLKPPETKETKPFLSLPPYLSLGIRPSYHVQTVQHLRPDVFPVLSNPVSTLHWVMLLQLLFACYSNPGLTHTSILFHSFFVLLFGTFLLSTLVCSYMLSSTAKSLFFSFNELVFLPRRALPAFLLRQVFVLCILCQLGF